MLETFRNDIHLPRLSPRSWLITALPAVMSLSAFVPIVRNLEANAVEVMKKRCHIVTRVLWINFRFCCGDSKRAKSICHSANLLLGIHA